MNFCRFLLLFVVAPFASSCGEQAAPSEPQSGAGGTETGQSGSGGIAGASGGAAGTAGNAASAGGGQDSAGSAGASGGMAGSAAGGGATAGMDGVSGGAGASSAGQSGSSGAAGGPSTPTCDASVKPAIGGIGLSVVVSTDELVGMSYAVQAPGSEDWYLVEQRGLIRVFSGGALRPAPFLDVSSEIEVNPMYDERGLHSLAFPPDYATSGLFYVVITPSTGARAGHDLVVEYRRSATDPYVAETTAVRDILDLEGPSGAVSGVHNAYMARFGPDGMLYVGMGDSGGACNDSPGFEDSPQDILSPHGKLLRFDLSAPAPHGAADNPFVADGDPRVVHYGLRNPFRFNWDRLTGDLYIGDVGQDTHEEINVAAPDAKGLNFGWASTEGDESTCPERAQRPNSTVTAPIFFTSHGGGSGLAPACSDSPFCDFSSIIAGAVYRGTALPGLEGALVFGDWASDNLAALYHCNGVTSEATSIDHVRDANLPENGYLVKVGADVPDLASITSIVEDHAGELYITANRDSLLKLVPAP